MCAEWLPNGEILLTRMVVIDLVNTKLYTPDLKAVSRHLGAECTTEIMV